MKTKILCCVFLLPLCGAAQGLVNNGATLVLQNSAKVVIDGTNGNYLSQSSGKIKNGAGCGTMIIDGNWTNNSNNNGFSNDGTTVVLAGSNQLITGSASTVFYNLTLQGSGTKTLGINTSVGGQTSFAGVLSLGAVPLYLNQQRLTVTNNASTAITTAGGYIVSETNSAVNPGIVRWNLGTSSGAHTIPFGVAGTVIPFTFGITSPMAAATDYVDFSTRATNASDNQPWSAGVTNMYSATLNGPGEDDVVIDRWWSISPSAAITADLTFTYRGVENTLAVPYNTGQLGAQHWLSSADWDAPAGSALAVLSGTGTVTAPAQSNFNDDPWVLASTLAPLPVELLYFRGDCEANGPVLQWATASETQNDYFSILETQDGIHFTLADTIDGAGNSTQVNHYQWQDTDYNGGVMYYQLVQTDINGQSENFNYVVLDCPVQENAGMQIAPNPGNGNFTIEYPADAEGLLSIRVTDARGRLVFTNEVMLSEGVNRIPLQLTACNAGLYFLSVSAGTQTTHTQLIIQ